MCCCVTDALLHGFGARGLNDLARDLMNRILNLWPKLGKPNGYEQQESHRSPRS